MMDAAETAAPRYASAKSAAPEFFPANKPGNRTHDGEAALSRSGVSRYGDAFFENTELTAAEFGILAHRVIERRFNGTGGAGSGLLKLAWNYASVFFDSELGQKSLRSSFRKTEYEFLSIREDDGKKTYASRRIDLLFEFENEMYIVDYKTDKTINPELYSAQLAEYASAVQDLFSKKTRCFLFYLREGKAVPVN
jgi:ATP-dependent exoDNAse (exonuclease V) beta subunit